MDGCDGFGDGDFGGLVGFDGDGFDGIDSVDLLDGAEHGHAPGDHCQGPEPVKGVSVSEDGDLLVVRVIHNSDADLKMIFEEIAARLGLMQVPSILVGQKLLSLTTEHKILHSMSWSGASKGSMPRGYIPGMSGCTTMFRAYFQIPKREWGPFSTPVYDKEAGVYLDVSGMTWSYRETRDCESQFVVRVVPFKTLDHVSRQWCVRTTSVCAHRKRAGKLSQAVSQMLGWHQPSAQSVKNRNTLTAPAQPVVTLASESAAARPVSSGADLLSALGHEQVRAAACVAGLSGPPDTFAAGAATGEMVMVSVVLPRRPAVNA